MTTKKTSEWGGKRPGSGRKKGKIKGFKYSPARRKVNFTLLETLAEWLDSYCDVYYKKDIIDRAINLMKAEIEGGNTPLETKEAIKEKKARERISEEKARVQGLGEGVKSLIKHEKSDERSVRNEY